MTILYIPHPFLYNRFCYLCVFICFIVAGNWSGDYGNRACDCGALSKRGKTPQWILQQQCTLQVDLKQEQKNVETKRRNDRYVTANFPQQTPRSGKTNTVTHNEPCTKSTGLKKRKCCKYSDGADITEIQIKTLPL